MLTRLDTFAPFNRYSGANVHSFRTVWNYVPTAAPVFILWLFNRLCGVYLPDTVAQTTPNCKPYFHGKQKRQKDRLTAKKNVLKTKKLHLTTNSNPAKIFRLRRNRGAAPKTFQRQATDCASVPAGTPFFTIFRRYRLNLCLV